MVKKENKKKSDKITVQENKEDSQNNKNSDKNNKNENKSNKKHDVLSTIIPVIIVLIITFGIVYLISYASKPKTYTYNGFDFYKDQYGFWNVEIKTALGDEIIPFYYHPSELENIAYDQKINAGMAYVQNNNGSVVIVADKKFANPELSDTQSFIISYVEIQKITSKVFGMNTVAAFNEEIQGVENMKVFNCSMANQKIYVFELQLGEPDEENKVYSQGFCAILRVNKPEDTIMLADLVSYKLIGIMK